MRQVNDKVVDVVINLRPAEHKAGSILGGVLQANNYGLAQFGRSQVLGSVRIAGLTPLSELTLTTQQSDGVGYYRTDYEAPFVGTGMRWKGYRSQVQSQPRARGKADAGKMDARRQHRATAAWTRRRRCGAAPYLAGRISSGL